MSRIVVLGDVMVDVVARLSGPLAQASDAPAEIRFRGGGSAANTAGVARGGRRRGRRWWAGSATTSAGRAAAEELRAAGVDVRVALDPERPTGTCLVLIEPGGERTMAARRRRERRRWRRRTCRTSCSPRPGTCTWPATRCCGTGSRAGGPGGDRAGAARGLERLGGPVLVRAPRSAGLPRPRRRRRPAAAERLGGARAHRRQRSRGRRAGAGGALRRGGGHARPGRRAVDGRRRRCCARRPCPWTAVEDSAGAGDAFAAGFLTGARRERRPPRRWRPAAGWRRGGGPGGRAALGAAPGRARRRSARPLGGFRPRRRRCARAPDGVRPAGSFATRPSASSCGRARRRWPRGPRRPGRSGASRSPARRS